MYLEKDTGDGRQKAWQLPLLLWQIVAQQSREMQEQGVIQPSTSPWSSPVVLVRKRDGTNRFCVDHRGMNAVIKTDSFPLPRIKDLLGQHNISQF